MIKKLRQLFSLLAFAGFCFTVQAQTTILDQTLLTLNSYTSFTTYSVAGSETWNFNPLYGAVCSGYAGGQNYQNEDWLISPAMNLSQAQNVKLSFSHTRGTSAVMNVGVSQGWYKAFATANYTGNPATTQWVELTGLNQNIPTAWQFISSGELTIPASAKSATSRIAFRYKSSNTQSAMWEVKDVKVIAGPGGTNPGNTTALKVTNWNTEWLGCSAESPWDDEAQINNVASAMTIMDSDVYCIQEVSNTTTNPTIQTLVSLLGSTEWGGAIVPTNTGECNQRQAIIYKKSKVQLVNSVELSNGSSAQGNSYSYNWSSGRFPALYNINVVVGNGLVPVSLINIHAKSEDNNAMSYTRRKGASEGLKMMMDGSNYNTKNLIIIGDFNDYLVGTTSDACQCTTSPYKNFIDDTVNYNGITKNMTDVNTNWGVHPLIENMIISNELSANYVANSAKQEVEISYVFDDYYDTTSNHLPVSARFEFATLDNPDFTFEANTWIIYPNPAKNELNIKISDNMDHATPVIYDLTGRQMFCERLSDTSFDVSKLPAGIYIVKVGSESKKFIKE
ncbi:T9SS type A sorting domain-containing protein [Flavobacterium hauense]